MHELSIAKSLIDLASDYAEQQNAGQVERIYVRLGELSGLLKPLYFCFSAASRGTMCAGAVLDIEEVPLTVMCSRCVEIKKPFSRYTFQCPDCLTPTPEVVTGREMQLVAIEVANSSSNHFNYVER